MRYRNIAEAVSQLGLGLACQIIQRLCDLCAGQCMFAPNVYALSPESRPFLVT